MSKNNVEKLQKQNDDLRAEIKRLQTDLQQVKDSLGASTTDNQEIEKNVEFLSQEYEDFKCSRSNLQNQIEQIESRLNLVNQKATEIQEAVEVMLKYSYQYNLKLLGVPQVEEKETAKQSVDICLKLFKEMGIKVLEFDIDIAHRISNKNKSIPAPIVCKFTRRLTKEEILKQKKEVNKIDLGRIGLKMNPGKHIAIVEHLTPNQQELLRKTKAFQENNEYEFCWVKNQTILLRESSNSKIIRISTQHDLEKLCGSQSFQLSPSYMLPTPEPGTHRGAFGSRTRETSNREYYKRGRGRINGPRTRSMSADQGENIGS